MDKFPAFDFMTLPPDKRHQLVRACYMGLTELQRDNFSLSPAEQLLEVVGPTLYEWALRDIAQVLRDELKQAHGMHYGVEVNIGLGSLIRRLEGWAENIENELGQRSVRAHVTRKENENADPDPSG